VVSHRCALSVSMRCIFVPLPTTRQAWQAGGAISLTRYRNLSMARNGGAGKTTLAVNLVVELSARHRILIVRTDPRQSAKELVARSRRRSTPRRRILLGSSTGVCRLLANLDPVD
jgi:Ni2+-binding GTPase involved in maturation of urease and hydrogenase